MIGEARDIFDHYQTRAFFSHSLTMTSPLSVAFLLSTCTHSSLLKHPSILPSHPPFISLTVYPSLFLFLTLSPFLHPSFPPTLPSSFPRPLPPSHAPFLHPTLPPAHPLVSPGQMEAQPNASSLKTMSAAASQMSST